MADSNTDEQHIVMKIVSDCIAAVPVMVLGSGASCAYGIRGMQPLADYLIEHVAPDPVDNECWNVLKAELASHSDLEEALQTVNVSDPLLRQIVSHTRKMIVEDEYPIYSRLVDGTLKLALSDLFRHLLQTTHKIVNVVTTNYDRLVEYAACQAKFRFNTGFSEGAIRHFHCQKSDPGHYTRHANFRCIDIWKVHGSIDWFQDSDSRPLGLLDGPDLPQSLLPLIVTPGTTKYLRTHQEPFRSVMSFADQALSAARGFLCIGYGFSDEHIEPKLIQRTADLRPPVVILARTLRPGAKRFLAQHMHSKVVALEHDTNGTRAYTERHPTGLLFKDEKIWSLDGLLHKVGIL